MCSIPGQPTPGTEVPVLLTRVNLNPEFGLIELWVNMDDGRKDIYKQMKEEIQIPKRKFHGSEGKPGDLCLVYISDAWHRARIVSHQREAYYVFLLDLGQSRIATSETLAWGNSDDFLLPPEIESCILANVLTPDSTWCERAAKFLKSLPGKKFKGVVRHVLMPGRTILLDIPIISNHMCMFGAAKKVLGDEFKSFVVQCLRLPEKCGSDADHLIQKLNLNLSLQTEKHDQYFHPELSTNMFETVTVTEVIDPNNIFCKLIIFSKALKFLSEQIHQHYEERSGFDDAQQPTCGDPCAAKGTNGRWHRSLLKRNSSTAEGVVEVLHVDYGKTEVVPVRDIRPLHGKFLKMPVVTYLCSLAGVEDNGTGWTTEHKACLKALILNQTVVARFHHHNIQQDVYYVTLYAANSACINGCFMEDAGLLPPDKGEHDSDVQKAPVPSAFLSSLEVEQHTNAEKTQEPLLSIKNQALDGEIDVLPTPGADDIHITGSLELSGALSNNEHPAPGFPKNDFANDIEVGKKEKVLVTFAEDIHHFYCHLERDSHVFNTVIANVNQLVAQPQSEHLPLGLDSICLARYSDGQWYRGQIAEVSPELKVRFVDYGDTVPVKESDVCPFPSESCIARSVPVLAVPLGLSDVPVDVPLEVNEWFADRATDHGLTISVVAKGAQGKLIVELFDGSTNVNAKVREMISKMTQQRTNGQQSGCELANSSEQGAFLCTLNGFDESRGSRDDKVYEDSYSVLVDKPLQPVDDHEIAFPQYAVEIECEVENVTDAMKKYWKPAATDQVMESTLQSVQSESTIICPIENVHKCTYDKAKLSRNKAEVYASCIGDPHFFWCQYANAEGLGKVSTLTQEAEWGQQDVMDLGALGPGSPCLALFSSDNLWHRAQVIHRTGDTVTVLFVDHGNESDVDLQNVRPLPVSLLKMAPQAFLCCLSGFDESKGSWDEKVYDDFYSLIVDKPLQLTVVDTKDYSEYAVPQYEVLIESGNVIVNDAMQKHWNAVVVEQETTESHQSENSLQCSRAEINTTPLNVFSKHENVSTYKKPEISINQIETVYASCIAEPNYFWCQYSNTKDLSTVSMLAQEAGQAQQDTALGETLGPGSPCLAQFSSDNQWYRAQVIQKNGDTLHVVFVDYGNESDVDLQNVRPLPVSLLEMAPQAFLCSLNGFDGSKGSWDVQAYDDFYNLLGDKPLRVTVLNVKDHAEIAVPQFAVEIECEGAVVNELMGKYWKAVDTDPDLAESSEAVDQDESRSMDESFISSQHEMNVLDSDNSLWQTTL